MPLHRKERPSCTSARSAHIRTNPLKCGDASVVWFAIFYVAATLEIQLRLHMRAGCVMVIYDYRLLCGGVGYKWQ